MIKNTQLNPDFNPKREIRPITKPLIDYEFMFSGYTSILLTKDMLTTEKFASLALHASIEADKITGHGITRLGLFEDDGIFGPVEKPYDVNDPQSNEDNFTRRETKRLIAMLVEYWFIERTPYEEFRNTRSFSTGGASFAISEDVYNSHKGTLTQIAKAQVSYTKIQTLLTNNNYAPIVEQSAFLKKNDYKTSTQPDDSGILNTAGTDADAHKFLQEQINALIPENIGDSLKGYIDTGDAINQEGIDTNEFNIGENTSDITDLQNTKLDTSTFTTDQTRQDDIITSNTSDIQVETIRNNEQQSQIDEIIDVLSTLTVYEQPITADGLPTINTGGVGVGQWTYDIDITPMPLEPEWEDNFTAYDPNNEYTMKVETITGDKVSFKIQMDGEDVELDLSGFKTIVNWKSNDTNTLKWATETGELPSTLFLTLIIEDAKTGEVVNVNDTNVLNTNTNLPYSTQFGINDAQVDTNEELGDKTQLFNSTGDKWEATGGVIGVSAGISNNEIEIDVNERFMVKENGVQKFFVDNTVRISNTNLEMNSNKIINLADPINDQDAATKKYVDDNAGGGAGFENQFEDLTGDFGILTQLNAQEPTIPEHYANKKYVDDKVDTVQITPLFEGEYEDTVGENWVIDFDNLDIPWSQEDGVLVFEILNYELDNGDGVFSIITFRISIDLDAFETVENVALLLSEGTVAGVVNMIAGVKYDLNDNKIKGISITKQQFIGNQIEGSWRFKLGRGPKIITPQATTLEIKKPTSVKRKEKQNEE